MSQRVPFKSEPISLDRLVEIMNEYASSWHKGSDIDPDKPLIGYGFDSLDVVEAWVMIEDEIGREIDIGIDVNETCRNLHERICKG